jgi:predicted adenine nucleotide alpha hydrolase (AANH) superfamily ATPase
LAREQFSPPSPDKLIAWFYNPNIQPREEHHRRRDAVAYLLARLGSQAPGAPLELDLSPPYEPEVFLKAAASEPEEPQRCLNCYAIRLKAAAEAAKRLGVGSFTTTLLYSRRQKHDLVAEAGAKAAAESGLAFYYEDFRTGWSQGIELSKKMELYRQRWCGCVYEGI